MRRWVVFGVAFLLLTPSAWAVTPPKRMWWTPARETRRQALKAANHISWQNIETDSDTAPSSSKTSTEDARTSDTIRYQLTGDATYADQAETTWDNNLLGTAVPFGGDPNGTREHFMEYVWGYDWLVNGGLDATEKANWITSLNYWTDLVRQAPGTPTWGTSKGDIDELLGHYFGVITWALVSQADNAAKSADILSSTSIGGLPNPATVPADKSTWRSTIKYYLTVSSNGSGPETSQYDLGTLQLAFLGADAVNTIKNDGTDYFPEITQLAERYARFVAALTTPDRRDVFKYSSVEASKARNSFSERRKPFANELVELMGANPLRPYINDYQERTTASAECLASLGECYGWRGFLFGDPTLTNVDYRTGLDKGFVDLTRGLYIYHDDWTNDNGSAFYASCPNTTFITVGHAENSFCTWDLYRNTDWAVTHIVGYDQSTGSSQPNKTKFLNTMVLGGLPTMQEVRQAFASQSANDFGYLVASTAGNRYFNEVTDAPNRFVHEWTRSYVYLPSTDASVDVVLIFDRVNADDPKSVTNPNNYHHSSGYPDQVAVDALPPRKQWALHAPVLPSTSGTNAYTWTSGTNTVRLDMFLPVAANRTASAASVTGIPTDTETGGLGQYRILLSETPDTKFSVFANAVQAYNASGGTPATITLRTATDATNPEACAEITNGTNEVNAFNVVRPGHNDYIVAFNAHQACNIPNTDTSGTITWNPALPGIVNQNRLRTTGFTLTLPTGTATRKLLVADLDPTLSWKASVDGDTAQDLGVSTSSPIGTRIVSGTGTHTVVVSTGTGASDTTDPTVALTAPANLATVSDTVTVSATATDNVQVSNVQFLLNSANLGAADFSSPYSISWDTTTVANGSYTLGALATDTSGNDATATTRSVTVSNSVPVPTPVIVLSPNSLSFFAQENGAAPANQTVALSNSGTGTLSWTATDNASWLTVSPASGSGNGTLTASVSTTGLAVGVHTGTITVADSAASNTPQTVSVSFTISPASGSDTTPPTVTLTAPASGATVSGSIPVTADATDNVGVVGVQFKLDGANLGAEDTQSPFFIAWNTAQTTNATHTLSAVARDAAGNTSTTSDVEAISFDAASSQVCNSACTTTHTWNHTVGTGSHPLLVACVVTENAQTAANAPITGITYNGDALTKVDAQRWGSNAENAELWYLLNPDAGTHPVVVTFTGTNSDGGIIGFGSSYFGVLQSGQPDATTKATGTSTTITTATTTATDNAWVVDCAGDQSSSHTLTVGAGQTVIGNLTSTGDMVGGSSYEGPKTPTGSVTSSWTPSASATWGTVAAAFKPSTGLTVTVSNGAPSTGLITDVSSSASGTYEIGTVAVGQLLYTDRLYTFSTVPSYLTGLDYIRTANGDRLNSDAAYLTLTLSADATVFAIVNGVDPIPGWLDSTWTLRPEIVDTTDNDGDNRRIYSRTYEAGSVVLGGKNYAPGSGSDSNFLVAAAPIFIEVTAPAADATVSGASTSVTASVGTTANVAGVQFLLDGANLGAEDTTSTYGITWNTTTAGNGAHTLAARIRQTSGDLWLSQGVAVTVSNSQADVTAPVLSGVSSGSLTTTGATITWTTDEPATTQVQYGLDTNYGTTSTLDPTLSTNHSVTLTGLTAGLEGGAGTTYHFQALSVDQAGNSGSSSDTTFVTTPVPDATDPVLSAIVCGATATTTATCTWTTDESADSDLELRTAEVDIVGTATHTDATDTTSHTLNVTGLTANTTYYGKVRSTDPTGNVSDWSDTVSFTTPAVADTTAPVISDVVATPTANSATITFTTNELCDTQWQYGPDTNYGTSDSSATDVLSHSFTISNLDAAIAYHYQVRCQDPSGNTSAYTTDATFTTDDNIVEPTQTEFTKVILWLIKASGVTINP